MQKVKDMKPGDTFATLPRHGEQGHVYRKNADGHLFALHEFALHELEGHLEFFPAYGNEEFPNPRDGAVKVRAFTTF